MRASTVLARESTPDGSDLVLYVRDGVYTLRVDGLELMTSRAHGSEEALARLACAEIAGRAAPRVLIGGLGFGYTLRAALDHLPDDAEITVCEVFESVLAWNRGVLAELAGNPLADPRVRALRADLVDHLAETTVDDEYDAILLDVDNGPEAFTLLGNDRLYGRRGVERFRSRLASGGVLAVWSAARSPAFSRRLRRAGLDVTEQRVRARDGGKGLRHTVFLARRQRDARRSTRRRRTAG